MLLGDVFNRNFCERKTPSAVCTDDDMLMYQVYQLQAEQFKEDFEHERRDHQRTKAQVESLTIQWNTLREELQQCQAKVRCIMSRYISKDLTMGYY